MTRNASFFTSPVVFSALRSTLLGFGGMVTFAAVWAQASVPSTGPVREVPGVYETAAPPDSPPAAATAARTNAANTAEGVQGTPSARALKSSGLPGVRGGLITQVGTGQPVSEGGRVLRLPGKCTPKTNSLDCVTEGGQAPNGANVSSRVRNGVVNEVGAGRGATEGSGHVKRTEGCTPQPGRLTCE